MSLIQVLMILLIGMIVGIAITSPDVATALGMPADPLGAAASGIESAISSWIQQQIRQMLPWMVGVA